MNLITVLLLTLAVVTIYADIYLQNPRGSNNRVNGQGRNRRNANRMFDSQNNDRGGYNAGGLNYHVGSTLSIEWTNQHSCSGPNNDCQLIIQYMCNDQLRNGVTESTIPERHENCENNDCNTDFEYGMHENYDHYAHCRVRKRNYGIFTADQNLRHYTARYTRQNPNGQRRGYECPEERDYYPYFGNSPWKDIAVLTSDTSRCAYYQKHSANVADRWHCMIDLKGLGIKDLTGHFLRNPVPQTEKECERFVKIIYIDGKNKEFKGEWVRIASHNIKAPDCGKAPESRDNHNGNGKGGFPNVYNWTIPNDVNNNCALRIRYNISTGEFPWETYSDSNGKNKNNKPCKSCGIKLGDQLGIDDWDAEDRGYLLTNNPTIIPLKIGDTIQEKFQLKLAVNTAQFGRTFQDRSHTFAISKRPDNIPAETPIHNLNVRGKRGNIVQTYPATEYDFVPNRLHLEPGHAIHIQWTGSDNNPGNNDGQGKAQTDRSNIVQLRPPQYERVKNALADKGVKHGHWANSYPDNVNKTSFLGFSYNDEKSLALVGFEHYAGDIDELDETSANYNFGARIVNKEGVYRYMCTRNNNFSNRGQKGVVVVAAPDSGKRDVKKPVTKSEIEREIVDIETLQKEISNIISNQ